LIKPLSFNFLNASEAFFFVDSPPLPRSSIKRVKVTRPDKKDAQELRDEEIENELH
jgi:hypothetical protein